MKTLKIAVTITEVLGIYCGMAFGQDVSVIADDLAGKLNSIKDRGYALAGLSLAGEEDDGIFFSIRDDGYRQFFGLSSAHRSSNRIPAGTSGTVQRQTTPAIFAPPPIYIDPGLGLEKRVSPTPREVKYLYGDDGVTPIGIVGIGPSGQGTLLCRIYTGALRGRSDPIDDMPIFDGPEGTLLEYVDSEGVTGTVFIFGEPNWSNLLASAGIAEGVYYGLPITKITKAHNVYNGSGDRLFGIMKTVYFNGEGEPYRVELTKEKSFY